ncbi:hypothetical protein MHBO_000729 [Bonamia ostreae]|uniref:Uncharacterized protein n=1 Tax=Bonamia ostreae TaxID=126728 RepID=A0ABV2AGM1_9EUKA
MDFLLIANIALGVLALIFYIVMLANQFWIKVVQNNSSITWLTLKGFLFIINGQTTTASFGENGTCNSDCETMKNASNTVMAFLIISLLIVLLVCVVHILLKFEIISFELKLPLRVVSVILIVLSILNPIIYSATVLRLAKKNFSIADVGANYVLLWLTIPITIAFSVLNEMNIRTKQ